MKRVLLIAVLLQCSQLLTAQSIHLTQTVKGIVLDEQSGNVLENVNVIVEGITPSIASITDSTGAFRLLQVPIGRQTVRVSRMGYEEAVVQHIEVTSSKEIVLEIRLREKIRKLEEV